MLDYSEIQRHANPHRNSPLKFIKTTFSEVFEDVVCNRFYFLESKAASGEPWVYSSGLQASLSAPA